MVSSTRLNHSGHLESSKIRNTAIHSTRFATHGEDWPRKDWIATHSVTTTEDALLASTAVLTLPEAHGVHDVRT